MRAGRFEVAADLGAIGIDVVFAPLTVGAVRLPDAGAGGEQAAVGVGVLEGLSSQAVVVGIEEVRGRAIEAGEEEFDIGARGGAAGKNSAAAIHGDALVKPLAGALAMAGSGTVGVDRFADPGPWQTRARWRGRRGHRGKGTSSGGWPLPRAD